MSSKGFLCTAIVALFIGLACDADAMRILGKMNNGVIYKEATPEEQAIAKRLSEKLLNSHVDNKKAFNQALLETAMEEEELAFELANWRKSSTQRIDCQLLIDDDYNNEKLAANFSKKIRAASSQISQRDAWYRRIRERAIVESMNRLREIDRYLIGILSNLNKDIADINLKVTDSLRNRLVKKMRRIEETLNNVKEVDSSVNFDDFIKKETEDARKQMSKLSKNLPTNLSNYEPVLKIGNERGKEYTAVDAARESKQVLIQSIQAHIVSLLNEITMFSESTQATQDDLKVLYYEIGRLAYNDAMDGTTPKSTFNLYHLPDRILVKDFANDEKLKWELYWSLPSEITDRAPFAHKDDYKIPMPNSIIPKGMSRQELGIKRTSAVYDSMEEAIKHGYAEDWGIGGTDNKIW
jgi:ribosome-associated translation inhibitor RaiA